MIPEKIVDITKGQDIHDMALPNIDEPGIAHSAQDVIDEQDIYTQPKPYKPYMRNQLANDAQDFAYEHMVGGDAPVQDIGVIGQNDSYYDQYIQTREDLEDLNEVRAREQGFWSKIGGGIGRFATITAAGTVGNIVGTVAGIGEGLEAAIDGEPDEGSGWDRFWGAFWSNHVNKYVNDVINSANEAMPIYESKAFQDSGFLDRIWSSNFLGNFIANMGWTSAAILSTVLTGGMGVASLGSSIARGLGASKNAANWVYRIIGACTGSLAEASTEAINNYDEAKQQYYELSSNNYQMAKQALDKEMIETYKSELERLGLNTSPEQEPIRVNGLTPQEAVWQNVQNMFADRYKALEDEHNRNIASIEENATKAGTGTFGANVFWLTLSNSFGVFSNISTPMNNINRVARGSWKNMFKPAGELEAMSKKELYAREITEAISQGGEELVQKGSSETEKAYYGQYYNPEFTGQLRNYFDIAGEQYANVFKDPKAWEEFASGLFLGISGTAGAGYKVKKDSEGNIIGQGIRPQWTGGWFNGFREASEEYERSKQIYDDANEMYKNLYNDKNLQARARMVIGILADKEAMANAVENGDKKEFLDREGEQWIRICETFSDIGRMNDLKALVGSKTEMTDAELKEFAAVNSEEIKDENGKGTGRFKSNLPIVDANGELLTDSEEGRKQLRERMRKDQERMNELIDTYSKTIEETDEETGYQLSREQLKVLTWAKMKSLTSEDRLNKIVYNELLKSLKGKLVNAWKSNRTFRNDDDKIEKLVKEADYIKSILDSFNELSQAEAEDKNTYSEDERKYLKSNLKKTNEAILSAKNKIKREKGNKDKEENSENKRTKDVDEVVTEILTEIENNLDDKKGTVIAALLRMRLGSTKTANKEGKEEETPFYLASLIQELLEETYGEEAESMLKSMSDMFKLHNDLIAYDKMFREFVGAPQKALDLYNEALKASNDANVKHRVSGILKEKDDFMQRLDADDSISREERESLLNDVLSEIVDEGTSDESDENKKKITEILSSSDSDFRNFFNSKQTSQLLKDALDTLDANGGGIVSNIGKTKEFIENTNYNFNKYRYTSRDELVQKALNMGYSIDEAYEIVNNIRQATAVIQAQKIEINKTIDRIQSIIKEQEEKADKNEVIASEKADVIERMPDNAGELSQLQTQVKNVLSNDKIRLILFKKLSEIAKEITGDDYSNSTIGKIKKIISDTLEQEMTDDESFDYKDDEIRGYMEKVPPVNPAMFKANPSEEAKKAESERLKKLEENKSVGEHIKKRFYDMLNYLYAVSCYLNYATTVDDGNKVFVKSKVSEYSIGQLIEILRYNIEDRRFLGPFATMTETEPMSVVLKTGIEKSFPYADIEYIEIPKEVDWKEEYTIVGPIKYTTDGKTKITVFVKNSEDIKKENKNDEEKQLNPEEKKETKNDDEPAPLPSENEETPEDSEFDNQINEILNQDNSQENVETNNVEINSTVNKLNEIISISEDRIFFNDENHNYYICCGDNVEEAKKAFKSDTFEKDYKEGKVEGFVKAKYSPSKLRYPSSSVVSSDNAARGANIGDDVDLIVRNYFQGVAFEDIEPQLGYLDKDRALSIYNKCATVKSKIEEKFPGCVIYTNPFSIAAMYSSANGTAYIAGSPDMLVIDGNGVVHIMDMKAKNVDRLINIGNKVEHPDGSNDYEAYYVQTHAYAKMLEANGLNVDTDTTYLIQFSTADVSEITLTEEEEKGGLSELGRDTSLDSYTTSINRPDFGDFAVSNSIQDALSTSDNAQQPSPQQENGVGEDDAKQTKTIYEEQKDTLTDNETQMLDKNDEEFENNQVDVASNIKEQKGDTVQMGFMVSDALEYDWKQEQEKVFIKESDNSIVSEFLEDLGVFRFLNAGNLTQNARIYCKEITFDIKRYMSSKYDLKNNPDKARIVPPTIGLFIQQNGKMQLIGALNTDSKSERGIGWTGVDSSRNMRNNISIAVIPDATGSIVPASDLRRREDLGTSGFVLTKDNQVSELDVSAKLVKLGGEKDKYPSVHPQMPENGTYYSIENKDGKALMVTAVWPGRIQVRPKDKDGNNTLVPISEITCNGKDFSEAFKNGEVFIGSTYGTTSKTVVVVNSKGDLENITLDVPFDSGATIIVYKGGDGKWKCSSAIGKKFSTKDLDIKNNEIIRKLKWSIYTTDSKNKRQYGVAATLQAVYLSNKTTKIPISNAEKHIVSGIKNAFNNLNIQPKEVTYNGNVNEVTILFKDGTTRILNGNKTASEIAADFYGLLTEYGARYSMLQSMYLDQTGTVKSSEKIKMVNALVDLTVSNIIDFSTRNTRAVISYTTQITPKTINTETSASSNYKEVRIANHTIRHEQENGRDKYTFRSESGSVFTNKEMFSMFGLSFTEKEKQFMDKVADKFLERLYQVYTLGEKISEDTTLPSRDIYNGVLHISGNKEYRMILFDLVNIKVLPKNITLAEVKNGSFKNKLKNAETKPVQQDSNVLSILDIINNVEQEEKNDTQQDNEIEQPELPIAAAVTTVPDEKVVEDSNENKNDIYTVTDDEYDIYASKFKSDDNDEDFDQLSTVALIEGDKISLEVGEHNIHDLLDKISDNENSNIIKLLKSVISKNAKINVISDEDLKSRYGEEAKGATQRKTGRVYLSENTDTHTIIHELLHYVVPNILQNEKAAIEIRNCFEMYKRYIEIHNDLAGKYSANGFDIMYATTNVYEFMSELFSNKAVVEVLKSIPSDYFVKGINELEVNIDYLNEKTNGVDEYKKEENAKKSSIFKKIINAIISFFRDRFSSSQLSKNDSVYSVARKAGEELIKSFDDNYAESRDSELKKHYEKRAIKSGLLSKIYDSMYKNSDIPLNVFEIIANTVEVDIFTGSNESTEVISDLARIYNIEMPKLIGLANVFLDTIRETGKPLTESITSDRFNNDNVAKLTSFIGSVDKISNESQYKIMILKALSNIMNPSYAKIANGVYKTNKTFIGNSTNFRDITNALVDEMKDDFIKLLKSTKNFNGIESVMNSINEVFDNTNEIFASPTDLVNSIFDFGNENSIRNLKKLQLVKYGNSDAASLLVHIINNALSSAGIDASELNNVFKKALDYASTKEYTDLNEIIYRNESISNERNELVENMKKMVDYLDYETASEVLSNIEKLYKNGFLQRVLNDLKSNSNRRDALYDIITALKFDDNLTDKQLNEICDEVEDGLFGYEADNVKDIIQTINVMKNPLNRIIFEKSSLANKNNLEVNAKKTNFAEQIKACKI